MHLPPQKEGTEDEGNEVLKAAEIAEIKGKYRVVLQCSFSPEIKEQS